MLLCVHGLLQNVALQISPPWPTCPVLPVRSNFRVPCCKCTVLCSRRPPESVIAGPFQRRMLNRCYAPIHDNRHSDTFRAPLSIPPNRHTSNQPFLSTQLQLGISVILSLSPCVQSWRESLTLKYKRRGSRMFALSN